MNLKKLKETRGRLDHVQMSSRMKSDSTRSDWTAADRRGASLKGSAEDARGTDRPIGTVSVDGEGRW